MHSGIGGYSMTGINNVLINVVLIFADNLLNLLNCVKMPLPFFIVLLMWPTNPVVEMFNP